MSRKKTHEEYVKELAEKNPNVEVIGIYCGNRIKIPHRCKNVEMFGMHLLQIF